MSQKPIFVATHPRACSTAFERVFMTQRSTLQCVHEPFGDAFYYGPERLGTRYANDEQARLDSGFSQSTFKTVLDRIDREATEGKRILIKDMIYYLFPVSGKPASIAPSLHKIKRGVGTNTPIDTTPAVGNGAAKSDAHANGHEAQQHEVNGAAVTGKAAAEYPYDTQPEPGNPTVMPRALIETFHFAFLIRDPHFSVPSFYRCCIPPLAETTGFHYYDNAEAGYEEMRRFFDYMRSARLIGPHIATREQDADEVEGRLRPVVADGSVAPATEICVVDADDMLDKPGPTIEAFCRSVGIEYTPAMLEWDDDEDQRFVSEAFEKWAGFHNDAIGSKGLEARKHGRPVKTEAEFDADWTKKYGPEGAAIIRKAVDADMDDYLYLKQFAMKV